MLKGVSLHLPHGQVYTYLKRKYSEQPNAAWREELEGHGDLVSRLITPITHIFKCIYIYISPYKPQLSPLLTYLLSPPDPPRKRVCCQEYGGGRCSSAFRGLGFRL